MDMFVLKNGEKEGPYTDEEVRSRMRDGRLSKQDLWWQEGMNNWEPLSILPSSTIPPALPKRDTDEEIPSTRRLRAIPLSSGKLMSSGVKYVVGIAGGICITFIVLYVLIALLRLAFVGSADHQNRPATASDDLQIQQRAAIDSVRKQMNELASQQMPDETGAAIVHLERKLASYKAIDTSQCPADFRQAYLNYVSAHEELVKYIHDNVPKNAGDRLLAGLANGLKGEADGGFTRVTQGIKQRTDAVDVALEQVGIVAKRY